MRVNKRKTDYGEVARRSVQRDFQQRPNRPEKNPKPEIQEAPTAGKESRILSINPSCQYAKLARFWVGKLVRCVESRGAGTTTGWYEFVFDDDRLALNAAAEWSDAKQRYFLERPKFKN